MEFNLADLFESIVDSVPDETALVSGPRRLSYAQLDQRANQLAHHLEAAGIGPGDRFGVQLANGTEYLEAMLACFKIRAVPINVNYRYVAAELEYLYQDAGLVGIAFHSRFGPAVTGRPRHAVTSVVPSSRCPTGRTGRAGGTSTRQPCDAVRGPGFRPSSCRRPLLRLHRGHHGEAQRRALAPRRHLLRRHGRWRSPLARQPHHHARRAGREGAPPRGSPRWPSPRSCMRPGTGWRSPPCSGAGRW